MHQALNHTRRSVVSGSRGLHRPFVVHRPQSQHQQQYRPATTTTTTTPTIAATNHPISQHTSPTLSTSHSTIPLNVLSGTGFGQTTSSTATTAIRAYTSPSPSFSLAHHTHTRHTTTSSLSNHPQNVSRRSFGTTASLRKKTARKRIAGKTTPLSRPPHSPLTTQKRFNSEYERPFSLYRGTLDSFLIGSRRNYVRPSVTYAAGLGNTTLRHTRLHPEDYIHSIPAHKALPQYILRMAERRPGLYMAIGTLLLFTAVWDDYRRTNELYDNAMDSIFALKAKNFLIKQGERIFLETILIMLHQGVIVPLEQGGETEEQAAGRFVAEVQGMLAEIERHRDFRLSNIPLNILEVLAEQKRQSFWFRLQLALAQPLANPSHYEHEMNFISGVETDTPWDIIREQRALIETQSNEFHFESKLDSAGIGALYGLFYPLVTRYHHMPTELSIQAVPMSMQQSIRKGTAPMSKLVGRVRDPLRGSVLYDQFQESHRNESWGGNPAKPLELGLATRHSMPVYWNSDVSAEIYNSYYLQRASNLIKQCRDVEGKVALTMFGEGSPKELMMTYLSKAHRVLLSRQFKSQRDNFSPGDSHIFRYYFQRFTLVPYLNSLQYEMSELVLLRQRLMKVGRAVGIDPEIESFSPEVLHLLDPYDTKPKSGLRELTVQRPDGSVVVMNEETTGAHRDAEMLRDKVVTQPSKERPQFGAAPILSQSTPSVQQQLLDLNRSATEQLEKVNIEHSAKVQSHLDSPSSSSSLSLSPSQSASLLTASAPQLDHKSPPNPNDVSLIAPGASFTFQSTSSLSDTMVNLTDNSSDFARVNRHQPQLPIALTPTVSALYQPVKIHHLVETITENQYNIKGMNTIVDSLHHAQFADTPKMYPLLGSHPDPLSQEQYYVRSLFNPLQNAFGINDEEKYIRGLLACIDVTLLRNAAEYQRWLHLVPADRESFWDRVRGVVFDYFGVDAPDLIPKPSASRSEGYLDRNKLPPHLRVPFDGVWKPYTTVEMYGDGQHTELGSGEINIGMAHKKPVYYDSQVGDESWGDFIYRLMGWDQPRTEFDDETIEKMVKDRYGDEVDEVILSPEPLPFSGDRVMMVGPEDVMRNTVDGSSYVV